LNYFLNRGSIFFAEFDSYESGGFALPLESKGSEEF